ncbi:MAG: CBS domain-containing protein [Candidatus Pacearchaeota archaeon]|jgi:CBS domain-containing protein
MIKVKDLMNKVVYTEKDITVKEAAVIMSKMKIGSLVYIKDKKVVGILTERDVIKNISRIKKKISHIILKKPIKIDLNRKIEEAAKLMSHYKIKRLLVTEKDNLVGIITATDIIANSDILNDSSFFVW